MKKFIMSLDLKYRPLLNYLRQNTALLFTTNERVPKVIEEIKKVRYTRFVKPGDISDFDIFVPEGRTFLSPWQMGPIGSLGVTTKITRGEVWVTRRQVVVKEGQRVSSSQAKALSLLNISVASYSLRCVAQFVGGCVYPPMFWEKISDVDVIERMNEAYNKLAALAFASYPTTELTIPHVISSCYQNLQCLSGELDYQLERPHYSPTYYNPLSRVHGSSIADIFS